MELDPRYVDVTLRRWLETTGDMPLHVDSSSTFAQLTERHTESAAGEV